MVGMEAEDVEETEMAATELVRARRAVTETETETEVATETGTGDAEGVALGLASEGNARVRRELRQNRNDTT